MKQNIENAILSTFLFANEMSNDLSWIFKLDTSIFSNPFRKRVAEKINAVEDDAYGFLSYELEESVSGTQFEQDFIDILAQTPLSNTKKYHDKLVEDIRLESLC